MRGPLGAWSLRLGGRSEPVGAQTARLITLLAVAAAAVALIIRTSK